METIVLLSFLDHDSGCQIEDNVPLFAFHFGNR